MEKIFVGVNAITIASLFLAIIFTAGVVWRVEKKLDVSYKFFLMAAICILVAEILDLYFVINNKEAVALAVKIFRMLFAFLFLMGVFFMRNIVRNLDGEENNEKRAF